MAYNVYLFDLLEALPPLTSNPIKVILQGYFDRLARSTRFGTAYVRFETVRPAVAAHELVIYFMPGTHSILGVLSGKGAGSPDALGGHWGKTLLHRQSGRTGSEVINKATGPPAVVAAQLANLAFHEAMHNKLRLTNQQLHTGEGLRGSLFASQADPGGLVTDRTLLTHANVANMAGALDSQVPQWTDGIDVLLAAKRKKDAGVDAWDI